MNLLIELRKARTRAQDKITQGSRLSAAELIGGIVRYINIHREDFTSPELADEVTLITNMAAFHVLNVNIDELSDKSQSALDYLGRYKSYGFDTYEEAVHILTLYSTICDIATIASMNGFAIGHTDKARTLIQDIFDDKNSIYKVENNIKENDKFYISIRYM